MKRIYFLIILLALTSTTEKLFANDIFIKIANMVNNERQKVGLPKLTYNKKLEEAALSHSIWMARVQKMEHLQGTQPKDFKKFIDSDYFHGTRILKTGYISLDKLFNINKDKITTKPDANDRVSEVIAFASPNAGNLAKQLPIIVPGWMKSPGHRAVIVKTCWKDIGAAFAVSRNGSTYYCVTFGNN